jgi:hypothetical protein
VALASLVSHHSTAAHSEPPHETRVAPSVVDASLVPDASFALDPSLALDASLPLEASSIPEASGAHCVAPQTQFPPTHVQKLQSPLGAAPTHAASCCAASPTAASCCVASPTAASCSAASPTAASTAPASCVAPADDDVVPQPRGARAKRKVATMVPVVERMEVLWAEVGCSDIGEMSVRLCRFESNANASRAGAQLAAAA